jgi:transitional endoplasmic reticulum ATPase
VSTDFQDYFEGRLIRIIQADSTNGQVQGRYLNGAEALFSLNDEYDGKFPSRGDVLILAENSMRYSEKSAWTISNSIGVVKEIAFEGHLVVDDGIQLRSVLNDRNLEIAANNTIEYNEIDGVVRIVSATPLRSRDYATTVEDIAKEYLYIVPEKTLTFDDFGGYPEVVLRARKLIETQLNNSQFLKDIGARAVKGILFTGPPGTGKTHLARIIAQQSNAAFFLVSGPSIVSKWVGDTEEVLRNIFQAATQSEKENAIIFFDEIDSIAERRNDNTHEASSRLIAQLLTLIDGFDASAKNIVVIAATNRVEVLDPALTRPGRFDWEIEFGTPTLTDRYEILRVSMKGLKISGEPPIEDIARLTEGWSAAKLTSIWAEASLIAAGERRAAISEEDTAEAFELVQRRPNRDKEIGEKR